MLAWTTALAWLDGLVGVSLLALGGAGALAGRPRWFVVGALGAAATWFLALAFPVLFLAHRPFLALGVLAFRRDRILGWTGGTLLAAAILDAVVPRSVEPATAALAAALAIAVARFEAAARQPGNRREVVATQRSALWFAAALVLPHLLRWWPSGAAWELPLLAYLLAVLGWCASLAVGLLPSPAAETDAVVELADAGPGDTRLRVERETGPDAQEGPVEAALSLLRENARLQRELTARVVEVRESRSRLLAAAVGERQRLAQVLGDGAVRYLAELDRCLAALGASGDGVDRAMAERGREQVARTLEELDRLAQGLHPAALGERGLAAALADLADRSSVPVQLEAPRERFGEPAESTLWYACAEALANVGKHSAATRARVALTASATTLTVRVDDDGVGGAVVTEGGGLAGLVDRLAAVGGCMRLSPSASGGTRMTVQVPRP